jgi:hypothetical protein
MTVASAKVRPACSAPRPDLSTNPALLKAVGISELVPLSFDFVPRDNRDENPYSLTKECSPRASYRLIVIAPEGSLAVSSLACGSTEQAAREARSYELAGPRVYTLRELVEMTLRFTGKWRLIVPVPFAVAEIQARLLELLPNPPLTTGQVDLLKADNVASGALPGLRALNIEPKTVEEVVPAYLSPQVSGHR